MTSILTPKKDVPQSFCGILRFFDLARQRLMILRDQGWDIPEEPQRREKTEKSRPLKIIVQDIEDRYAKFCALPAEIQEIINDSRWVDFDEMIQCLRKEINGEGGINKHAPKLNYEIAEAIRAKNARGTPAYALANEYGVTAIAIYKILHNQTYIQP